MRILFTSRILFVFFVSPVWCNDVFNFDWRPELENHPKASQTPYVYDEIDHRKNQEEVKLKLGELRGKVGLESEHGSFENEHTDKRQRNPRPGNENTRSNLNALLKKYLLKMYEQKYSNSVIPHPSEDQESKYMEGHSWKNKTKTFANKFLSLFTVVKFPNAQCTVWTTSGEYTGTCYHASECTSMGGSAEGNCANGYGVCCVFRYSCGDTSCQNCTYFESPGYPNYDPTGPMVLPPNTSTLPPNPSPTPDPRLTVYYDTRNRWKRQIGSSTSMSCSISINKTSNDIQQMRIDFIDLELAGPTNGTCINERLVISGQNLNTQVPDICGYNTGQHVYVDVSMLSGPLQISVLSSTGARKRYKLRICQYSNSCANPNDCLQYYTGVSGMISSFNYDQAAMMNRSTPGYFNNLNYAICIRREAGYCSITYTNTVGGMEYPFQLVNFDDVGQPTVPPNQAGADVFNCPDDYIVIGGTRLCGNRFNDGSTMAQFTMNAPVTDYNAGPIVISVVTDGMATGRGFKIFYTQNMCTSREY